MTEKRNDGNGNAVDDFAVVRLMATEDGKSFLEYLRGQFNGMTVAACESDDDRISLWHVRRAEGLRWVIETLEKAQEDGGRGANPDSPDVSFPRCGVNGLPL